MANPTTEHMSAVKHILRYIAGTLHHGLIYVKAVNNLKIQGFSDADMAGDIDDRKSTSGMLFLPWSSSSILAIAEAIGGGSFIM